MSRWVATPNRIPDADGLPLDHLVEHRQLLLLVNHPLCSGSLRGGVSNGNSCSQSPRPADPGGTGSPINPIATF